MSNAINAFLAGRQMRQQDEDRQRSIGQENSFMKAQNALAGGDRDAAQQMAAGSSPQGYAAIQQQIAGLDDQQAAQAEAAADALGEVAYTAMNLPYEQRGGFIMQQSPRLAQFGVTPEMLSQFDPTDDNLQVRAMEVDDIRSELLRRGRPAQPTSDMRNFQHAQENPEFAQYQQGNRRAGATQVTVDNGQPAPQIGSIPPGYQVFQDPQSGGFRMEVIPGGEADREIRSDEDARANRSAVARRSAGFVLDEIDQAMNILTENPGAGGRAAMVARFDPGSNTSRLGASYQTINANMSFDRLQEMRNNSPTGGALGAISEREIDLLAAATARLAPTDPPDVQLRNLERAREVYNDIVKGDVGHRAQVLGYSLPDVEYTAAQEGMTLHQVLDALEQQQ